MAEAARTLKVNPKLAGQPCGWCAEPLALGADASLCTTCDAVHHAGCWDSSAGCSRTGCVNAPLAKLADVPAAAAAAVPPGYVFCPMCRVVVQDTDGLCPRCDAVLSPDGIYHGPTVTAPGAVASLVWGLVGLVLFGMILGIIAITKAQAARKLIASSPRYTGGGLAIAGMVLGIVDIVGWVLVIGSRCGR